MELGSRRLYGLVHAEVINADPRGITVRPRAAHLGLAASRAMRSGVRVVVAVSGLRAHVASWGFHEADTVGRWIGQAGSMNRVLAAKRMSVKMRPTGYQ